MTDAELIVEAVNRELGPTSDWKRPRGYPDSLALCVIDSVFSPRTRYSAVENVVATYREARVAQGGLADSDGTPELLTAIEAAGGRNARARSSFGIEGLPRARENSRQAPSPTGPEPSLRLASPPPKISARCSSPLRPPLRRLGG
jgi:hypothetical protein